MLQESPNENLALTERLERIQKLPLKSSYKVDLALIVLGEKPATEIMIFYPSNDNERVLDMERRLIDVGLEVDLGDERTKTEEEGVPVEFRTDGQIISLNCYRIIYVANSVNNANTLRQLGEKYFNSAEKIHPEDHRTFGRLFGFPGSAIEAFIQGQTIHVEDLPEDIQKEDYKFLLQFALSRNNWRNEIETTKQQYQALHENAPTLLDEYLKDIKAWHEERKRGMKAIE